MKNSLNILNIKQPKLYILLAFFLIITSSQNIFAQPQEKDVIEIRIYHIKSSEQEKQVDHYLKEAYLPALERAGIKLSGVLKPIEGDSVFGKKIYVIIPYPSIEKFAEIPHILNNDKKYNEEGKDYLKASHNAPPFERLEVILLDAFEGMPRFELPGLAGTEGRIYELRSYESATKNLLLNKVKMFNEGEIGIFERLDFNPVFFGNVLAGSQMPNLMYMTGFTGKEARDAHWGEFGKDPVWGKMSKMEEYQNNVSHIDIILLKPTTYSKL